MAEKNEKKNKKGNAFGIIAVILLIIAIALILIGLFGGLGFGNGSGNGTGTGSGNTGVESSVSENSENPENVPESPETAETETTTKETEPEVTYIDVTVSGSSYLIDGAEVTIDDIKYSAENGNVIVRITDDNAIADSMDALISDLDGAGISHVS